MCEVFINIKYTNLRCKTVPLSVKLVKVLKKRNYKVCTMNSTGDSNHKMKSNQNIQVYLRVRPTNARERLIRSNEIVEVSGCSDIIVKQTVESRTTKKFSFDRAFGMDSQQVTNR